MKHYFQIALNQAPTTPQEAAKSQKKVIFEGEKCLQANEYGRGQLLI